MYKRHQEIVEKSRASWIKAYGHEPPEDTGPGTWLDGHFWSTRCLECCSLRLSRMNLVSVENYFEQGIVTQDMLDGYKAAWAELSPSRSNPHWVGSRNDWTEAILNTRSKEVTEER